MSLASRFPALAYAPLMPVAAAATLGLVMDRYLAPPPAFSLAAAIICLITWSMGSRSRWPLAAETCLCLCWLFSASAYHHLVRHSYAADDMGQFARESPTLMCVRGTLSEEPVIHRQRQKNPLVSRPRSDTSSTVIHVASVEVDGGSTPASGNLQLYVDGVLDGLHLGDEVQATGWVSRPASPANPGEFDHAARQLDRRIRAEMHVPKNEDAVVRLQDGWRHSFFGWLAVVRGWGQRVLHQALPPEDSAIASALLLGEGSSMTSEDWDKYVRTGVIHVLAISGQHLVVLSAGLWVMARALGIRRRQAAFGIALIVLGYALLTGGRPSAMRAAVMVGAMCAGLMLRRPTLPANTFALAWIVVLVLDPTDLFTAGFQLSFLCVAVLLWGIPRWFPLRPPDPIQQLLDEGRSRANLALRRALRVLGRLYLITFILTLCSTPLVIYWQNVVSPVGLLIGPIAIVLSEIALWSGFLLLLCSVGGLVTPFAIATQASISACEWVVVWAGRLPGGSWYIPNISAWWVTGFYLALILWMAAVRPAPRVPLASNRSDLFTPIVRPAYLLTILGVWLALGLLAGMAHAAPDEVRITFVAVGHGGCTVIETLDGRVLLYDAGSLTGPEVTRRHIAPFLWSRGISRVDEVFISHADLDHFNGLPALADRFNIGQITWTPSFQHKQTAGVEFVVENLRQRGIPIREVRAGDRFAAAGIDIKVLHPPQVGPEGNENSRSMVLLVEHEGHRLLLTGDLEQKGLDYLLDMPPVPVDVLMAPHHGSRTANPDRLADWARPRLAIACDGPRPIGLGPDIYTRKRIPYWITFPHGAITLRSHRTGLIAETFCTGQRVVVSHERSRDVVHRDEP